MSAARANTTRPTAVRFIPSARPARRGELRRQGPADTEVKVSLTAPSPLRTENTLKTTRVHDSSDAHLGAFARVPDGAAFTPRCRRGVARIGSPTKRGWYGKRMRGFAPRRHGVDARAGRWPSRPADAPRSASAGRRLCELRGGRARRCGGDRGRRMDHARAGSHAGHAAVVRRGAARPSPQSLS